MFSRVKIKIIFILCFFISITYTPAIDSFSEGVEEMLPQIRDKITRISEDEKQVLQKLFLLTHEIEGLEREAAAIGRELDKINIEMETMEETIKGEEAVHAKEQENLKHILRSYQRGGPGSYLEIILKSDSLDSFLKRLNIVRDLAQNTGKLLNTLEERREKLFLEKADMAEKRTLTQAKQKQLSGAIEEKSRLKGELEGLNASLAGEMEYYQAYLAEIEKEWKSLEYLFFDVSKEFVRFMDKGDLPLEALKIEFNFLYIKGSIDEKAFNSIVDKNSLLPEIQFGFLPDKLQIRVPEKNVVFRGRLVVENLHTLKFEAEEGNFHGMPLEKAAVEELFLENPLTLDLKPMLAGGTISAVRIVEGNIELTIIPAVNWGY